MKEQAIQQILREAAEGHTAPAPDQLWERLESSLPAASPRSARKLRLYPRSQRYLLPAVAASILVLVVAAWFALGQWASPGAPLAQQHGQLELTEAPSRIFDQAIYEGVTIKAYEAKADAELHACVRC